MTTETTDPTTTEPRTTTTTPPSTRADQEQATTGTDPAQQPATGPQDGQQQDQDDQEDGQREAGPGAEAARYRRQLRTAEAERDALREQLAGAQRRELERAVGDLLAVPGDLLEFGGHELAEFVRNDGTIDVELVQGAAAVLVGTRPGLAKVEPRPRAPHNGGAGYRGPSTAGPAGWSGVLRPH